MIHENSENFNSDFQSLFHDDISKTKFIVENLKKIGISESEIRTNESLKLHSTFKIGGNALVFLSVQSAEQLFSVLSFAKSSGVPYFVLGGGSNVVFADDGFPGIVISTQKLCDISLSFCSDSQKISPLTENSSPSECLVCCGAGAAMSQFVSFCTENNLSGAEEFAGLPGTVGGAVYMNARCFDKSISDILVSSEYLAAPAFGGEFSLQKKEFSAGEWDYKKSPFQSNGGVIVSAVFRLKKCIDSTEIDKKCTHFISERKNRGHFKYPSAGSVFKNNRNFGAPSGKLIDDVGLKGVKIGGAQIAPWHGNFIVNTGNATAEDVRALVDLAIEKVRERTGFTLECEIIFVS